MKERVRRIRTHSRLGNMSFGAGLEWLAEWMNRGWKDGGWVDGWMDGWTDDR